MKRNVFVPLLALLVLALGACGGPQVPEELLPTRIPELTMDTFYAAEVATDSATAETTDASSAAEAPAAAETVVEADAAPAEEAPAEEGPAPEAAATETEAAPAAADAEAPAAAAEGAAAEGAAPAEEAPAEAEAAPAAADAEAPAAAAVEEAAAEEAAPAEEAPAEAEAAPAAAAEPAVTESLVPEAVTAALAVADPARGQQLTLQNACIGCHNLDPNVQMAGPTWANMANTAATRVAGESAEEYLYNSIVHPNDYLVEGYMAGVMLQNYGDTLSDQDIADIMAYLLTLQGE